MVKTNKAGQLASSKKSVQEDIRRLVLARIKAASGDLRIAVGSDENRDIPDMVKSVERGDKLGQRLIDAHMEFLRDMAEGKIYQDE